MTDPRFQGRNGEPPAALPDHPDVAGRPRDPRDAAPLEGPRLVEDAPAPEGRNVLVVSRILWAIAILCLLIVLFEG